MHCNIAIHRTSQCIRTSLPNVEYKYKDLLYIMPSDAVIRMIPRVQVDEGENHHDEQNVVDIVRPAL